VVQRNPSIVEIGAILEDESDAVHDLVGLWERKRLFAIDIEGKDLGRGCPGPIWFGRGRVEHRDSAADETALEREFDVTGADAWR